VSQILLYRSLLCIQYNINFHTKYVHKCIINIHVKSYIRSPKVCSYYTAECCRFLTFYTITTKTTHFTRLLCYGRRQNATLNDDTVVYTTEVRTAAMSVSLLVALNVTSVKAEGIRVYRRFFLESSPNSSTVIFIVTTCMLSSHSIITPTTAHI